MSVCTIRARSGSSHSRSGNPSPSGSSLSSTGNSPSPNGSPSLSSSGSHNPPGMRHLLPQRVVTNIQLASIPRPAPTIPTAMWMPDMVVHQWQRHLYPAGRSVSIPLVSHLISAPTSHTVTKELSHSLSVSLSLSLSIYLTLSVTLHYTTLNLHSLHAFPFSFLQRDKFSIMKFCCWRQIKSKACWS